MSRNSNYSRGLRALRQVSLRSSFYVVLATQRLTALFFALVCATFLVSQCSMCKDAKNPNQHQGGAHGGCMQSHTDLRKSPFVMAPFLKGIFGKAALTTAALSGFVLFAGVPSAKADDCRHRIAHAEHELGEAIEDHGYYSRQADHWRHERHEAYEACGERGYYRGDQNSYYRDRNGYYRDERGNYLYFRYDHNRDRDYRDYDRDRRRNRDWDRDRD